MSSSSTPASYHAPPRYHAHHVRESLSTRLSKAICCGFLSLLLVAGLLLFILWLQLRPHRPRFHLASFSAPVILSLSNASISFNVTDRNPNENVGIFYNQSRASLFYGEEKIGSKPLLFQFYQPPKNTKLFEGVFDGEALAVSEKTWEEFRRDVDERGTVEFRLELRSRIRFKVSAWESRRSHWDSRRSHLLHASCNVRVGPDGLMLPSFKGKRCPLYFF